MKTILMAAIAGVVLFAASASISWFLMNQTPKPAEEAVAELEPETEAGVPAIGDAAKKEEQMPVAMRPNVPLTVEAVLELSESIRKKERELIEREKQAQRTERNIELLFEDLKVERAELTALAESLNAKLSATRNSVAELKVENQQLTTQTQELAALNPKKDAKPGEAELDEIGQRVKTAQPWFEGLEDEQAANYLKEFANNGDLEFAARLLKSLQQRKASKILAAFNDPDFVQQILKALSEQGEKSTIESEARSNAGQSLR